MAVDSYIHHSPSAESQLDKLDLMLLQVMGKPDIQAEREEDERGMKAVVKEAAVKRTSAEAAVRSSMTMKFV